MRIPTTPTQGRIFSIAFGTAACASFAVGLVLPETQPWAAGAGWVLPGASLFRGRSA